MEWFIAMVVGGLIGWGVFALTQTEHHEGTLSHVIAGILGGLAGKWILSSVWVVGSYIIGDNFNLYSVLWAAIGGLVFAGIWRAMALAGDGREHVRT